MNIFRRFTSVLSLTYKRYKDLKQAEANAREAQIEASLERVRGKAMAMHSSKDLSDTVGVFFKELRTLSIMPIRCGVGELDEANTNFDACLHTTAQQLGESYEIIGKLKLAGHPVLENIFEHWKSQQEYYPVLMGQDHKRILPVHETTDSFPDYPDSACAVR